jgi:hypothetical protein
VYQELGQLVGTLRDMEVPESCEEVTLELETRHGQVMEWAMLMRYAEPCTGIELVRRDGRCLRFDKGSSVLYTWAGRVGTE